MPHQRPHHPRALGAAFAKYHRRVENATALLLILCIPLLCLVAKAFGVFGKPPGKECGLGNIGNKGGSSALCDERFLIYGGWLIALPMLTIMLLTAGYAIVYERARWRALNPQNPEDDYHISPTASVSSDGIRSQVIRDQLRPGPPNELQQRVVIHPGEGGVAMARLPEDRNSIFEPAPAGCPPYKRSPPRGNYEYAAPSQWWPELPF